MKRGPEFKPEGKFLVTQWLEDNTFSFQGGEAAEQKRVSIPPTKGKVYVKQDVFVGQFVNIYRLRNFYMFRFSTPKRRSRRRLKRK